MSGYELLGQSCLDEIKLEAVLEEVQDSKYRTRILGIRLGLCTLYTKQCITFRMYQKIDSRLFEISGNVRVKEHEVAFMGPQKKQDLLNYTKETLP